MRNFLFSFIFLLGTLLLGSPQFAFAATPSPSVSPAPTASPMATASPAVAAKEAESPIPTRGMVDEFGKSSVDFTWLFLKTIFAMIIVIGLAIVLLRYIIPKVALGRSRGVRSDIQVVERIPLDQKKMLYVVHVEGRRLLVGTSEHSVGLITELNREEDQGSD